MKRIFILAVLFMSLFSMASAISLNELRNNPGRYQHVFAGPSEDEYVDISSVNVVRYNPPYYIINAKAYAVYYDTNTITLYDNSYYLNYDRSLNRLIPLYGEDKARGVAEWKRDSGIKWNPLGLAVYNFDGSTKIAYTASDYVGESYSIPAKPLSPAYMAGMYAFYKAYNTYFNPPMKGQFF